MLQATQRAGDSAPTPAGTLEGNLRRVATELADDRYAGRGPGSPGDVAARAWLAEELARIGYRPGMPDGTWEQPFDIVGVKSTLPEHWHFRGPRGEAGFRFGDEAMAASGVQAREREVAGVEVVFAGYGIQAPEERWNDFEATSVEGKVLLVLKDDPDWDPELFGGKQKLYYGRWTYTYESAARQKAAAAIIVHTTASAGYPWSVVRSASCHRELDQIRGWAKRQ
jgi:hypothetical protein